MGSMRKKMAASKELTVARAVRLAIDARLEHKSSVSTLFTATDLSSGGVIRPLTQFIVQGDDINQRSGDQITLKSSVLRIDFRNNNITPITTVVRVVVFYDTMASGALPAVSDLVTTYIAGINPVNKGQKRFTVVSDDLLGLVALTQTQVRTYVKSFASGKKVHYIAGTDAATSLGRNQLMVLLMSNVTGAAGINVYTLSAAHEYIDA